MPIEKEQTNRKEENKVQTLTEERREIFEKMDRKSLKNYIKENGYEIKILKRMTDNDIRNAIIKAEKDEEKDPASFAARLFLAYGLKKINIPEEEQKRFEHAISSLPEDKFRDMRDELDKNLFFKRIFKVVEDENYPNGFVKFERDKEGRDASHIYDTSLYEFMVKNLFDEENLEAVKAAMVLNNYVYPELGSSKKDFTKGMLLIMKELYYATGRFEEDDEEFTDARRTLYRYLIVRDKGFAAGEDKRKEQDEEGMLRAGLKSVELLLSRPRTEEDIRKELLELKDEKEELWRNFIDEGFESAERNSMRVEICESHFSFLKEELDLLPARQKMEKLSRNFRIEEERDAIYSAHTMLLKAKQLRDGVSRKMNRNNFESLLKIIERPLGEGEEEYEFLENMRNYIEGIKNGRIRAFLSELREARELEARAEEEYSNVRTENIYKNKTNKREVK